VFISPVEVDAEVRTIVMPRLEGGEGFIGKLIRQNHLFALALMRFYRLLPQGATGRGGLTAPHLIRDVGLK
jgi:hypothetical protein